MASKITIKRSLTAAAPAGLSFGEMAFVQGSGNTAEQLYVGISGGNPVWVGARVEDTVTDWTSKTRLATQAATVTKINSLITSNTAGVASVNGLTGAVINVALTTNPLSQFAATTSSQLLGVISDETGTGSLVFATNPTLSGVTLGAATATTINNVAFTRPNSTATLTLYTGSSLTTRGTFDSQLEFTGTTDVTFPVSGTLSTLARIETLSNKTLSGVTLGTPLSGTLTNCTGLPVGTGISDLGTNVAAFLATPSSANLAAALTDETGSGANVFASSPTLVTPTLGVAAATSINKVTITTPATGSTLTILDGKTLAVNNTLTFTGTDASSVAFGAGGTVVYTSGLGTGVATFLATPSSANLISAVTDETGTGSLVFASSPTLVTPTLGVAAATSINKVTITTPATGSTITVADGKTLTASNTLTFTGTDASSVAFGTGGTVVYTSGLGTNVAAFLATPSSANLAAVLTDETGSGAAVFANTPTLVTPNIGAATGTSLVLSGDLTVNGTTTTLNSTTLTIDDKNIELGSVAVPDNTTAADGGITLKGATDKTLKWLNSGAFAWTSSENFDLVSTKAYYIAGASVLNATTLGTLVVNSSLTSVGTLTSLTVSGTLEAGLIDGGTF